MLWTPKWILNTQYRMFPNTNSWSWHFGKSDPPAPRNRWLYESREKGSRVAQESHILVVLSVYCVSGGFTLWFSVFVCLFVYLYVCMHIVTHYRLSLSVIRFCPHGISIGSFSRTWCACLVRHCRCQSRVGFSLPKSSCWHCFLAPSPCKNKQDKSTNTWRFY